MRNYILLTAALLLMMGGPLFAGGPRPVEVVVCDSHHNVLPHWFRAARPIMPRGAVNVLHFDAHPDMSLPPMDVPSAYPAADTDLQTRVTIDSFQLAACKAGAVGRVVWVRPEWAPQIQDGEYRFSIGDDPAGKLRVTSTLDYYVMTGVWIPENHLHNGRTVSLGVATAANIRRDSVSGPVIIDIDLDYFSTRNPAADEMREAGIDEATIQKLYGIFALENLNMSRDPDVCYSQVGEIIQSLKDIAAGPWYSNLGSYFTLVRRGFSPRSLFKLRNISIEADRNKQLEVLLEVGLHLAALPEHRAGHAEIDRRVAEMQHAIQRAAGSPLIVTIARSSDGFTHPDLLPEIEAKVLAMLKRTFGNITVTRHND